MPGHERDDRSAHPGACGIEKAPKLIITDSQVFGYVYENKPAESMLTSFPCCLRHIRAICRTMWRAEHIDALNAHSRILIAECCTHAPLKEDIGREKIPRMLRKRFGESLAVDIVSGTDFPKDLPVTISSSSVARACLTANM